MAIPFYESAEEDEIDGEVPLATAEQQMPMPMPLPLPPPPPPQVTHYSNGMLTFVSIGAPPLSLQFVQPPYQPSYNMWDFDVDEFHPLLLGMCKSLAEGMANLVKEYYDHAVSNGHPINNIVVHISPGNNSTAQPAQL